MFLSGKAESSGVAVLLRTEGADPLVSYEMINVCKDKPASRDVCTETPSPSLCSCQHVRAMQDGATSPCPLMDCSSPEELFIFDKELADGADGAEGESSSTPGLTAFGSELFDKLASIQKAFQVSTLLCLHDIRRREVFSCIDKPFRNVTTTLYPVKDERFPSLLVKPPWASCWLSRPRLYSRQL